jgi:hypothetical protein
MTYRDALFDDAVFDVAQPEARTAADARVKRNLELVMITLHNGSVPEQSERLMAALRTRDRADIEAGSLVEGRPRPQSIASQCRDRLRHTNGTSGRRA